MERLRRLVLSYFRLKWVRFLNVIYLLLVFSFFDPKKDSFDPIEVQLLSYLLLSFRDKQLLILTHLSISRSRTPNQVINLIWILTRKIFLPNGLLQIRLDSPKNFVNLKTRMNLLTLLLKLQLRIQLIQRILINPKGNLIIYPNPSRPDLSPFDIARPKHIPMLPI